MKSFKPRERVKRNPKRNKIAFILMAIIIGLLINNAIMSHNNESCNKAKETEQILKEGE